VEKTHEAGKEKQGGLDEKEKKKYRPRHLKKERRLAEKGTKKQERENHTASKKQTAVRRKKRSPP